METHKCLLFSSFFIEMLGKITSTTTNNVFGRDSVFTILMFHFLTPPPPSPKKKNIHDSGGVTSFSLGICIFKIGHSALVFVLLAHNRGTQKIHIQEEHHKNLKHRKNNKL